jgi:O-antigen/teichoic acid export membrane protein
MYKKTMLALIDQSMLSGINMIVAILFIKFSSKAEFGEYSLAIAIIMFASGVHNTLVHLPMTISGNKIDQSDRASFSTSLCVFLYIILILFTLLAMGIVSFIYENLVLQHETFFVLIFSISGILSRELIRSLFFADLKVAYVFIVDVIYVLIFSILIFIFHSNNSLTASSVITGMGVSSLLAAIVFIKPAIKHINLNTNWKEICENISFSWKDSKWMVSGMMLSWVVNNGYLFLLAYLISKEAVAELNGARILLVPLIIVVGAWGKVFLPKGASMVHEQQHDRIVKIILKSTAGLVVIAVFYIFVLYQIGDILEEFLYNNKYDNIKTFILLWGAFVLITVISTNLQNLISVFSQFKKLFTLSFINSSMFLFYCSYLIVTFGSMGAVYSLIIAKVILSFQYGHFYYTKRNAFFKGHNI